MLIPMNCRNVSPRSRDDDRNATGTISILKESEDVIWQMIKNIFKTVSTNRSGVPQLALFPIGSAISSPSSSSVLHLDISFNYP